MGRIAANERKRVAAHEFGHALGLEHEHQSPNGNCENEIDWDVAVPYLRKKWGINDDQILRNFRRLVADDLIATRFDAHSIMNYELPRSIFFERLFEGEARPACFVTVSHTLSDLDVSFARENYPADADAWRRKRSETRLTLFADESIMALEPDQRNDLLRTVFAVDPWDPAIGQKDYQLWVDRELLGQIGDHGAMR